jgi:hypothetical protein
MRPASLITCLRQMSFALTHTEAAQPLDVFRGVVAPPALGTTSEWQRAEPLSEPEPARTYAELVGRLADRECTLLLKHAPTVQLADRFL